MSKNVQKKNTAATAPQQTQIAQALEQAKAAQPKPALLTNTGMAYLKVAMDKASSPAHPNFVRAMDLRIEQATTPAAKAQASENKRMLENIRLASARALDAHPDNLRLAIVTVGRALKEDVRSYITFFKGLATDAAFAAHMDCVRLTKAVDPEALEAGLDAMGESHEITDDTPVFDVADAQHAAPREEYAGPEDFVIFADSVQDAYEGIAGVQAWLSLAVTNMPEESQKYWGVDGLFPLGQRVDSHPSLGKVYSPLRDFDAFREYQAETWKRKQRRVEVAPATEDLMLAG